MVPRSRKCGFTHLQTSVKCIERANKYNSPVQKAKIIQNSFINKHPGTFTIKGSDCEEYCLLAHDTAQFSRS
jgi:hypothetical protein